MNGPSRLFRPKTLPVALMLCFGFLAACAARPASLTVPLEYAPTNTLSDTRTLPPRQGKLYVLPVDDQRPDKTKIGENSEDPNSIVAIVASVPDAPEWVQKTVVRVLRANGLVIVDSADEADRLLNVSLTNFWVKEDSTYNARITAVVKVLDKNGTVWFTGTISGQDELTGKGLNVENYRQGISNSMFSAMDRLLNNTAFQQSLVVSPVRPIDQPPH